MCSVVCTRVCRCQHQPVLLSGSLPYSLRQGPSLKLEHNAFTVVAGQQAPGMPVSASPVLYAVLRDFGEVVGDLNPGPGACGSSCLLTVPSLQLSCFTVSIPLHPELTTPIFISEAGVLAAERVRVCHELWIPSDPR